MLILKKIKRNLLDNIITNYVLCALLYILVRVIRLTLKVEYDREKYENLINTDKPKILCFWHGRMLLMPFMKPNKQKTYVMISSHRDGVFISTLMKFFGLKTVFGSSSKGGSDALRRSLTLLKQGKAIAITPDGPRGPLMKAATGVAILSKISGCVIYPVTYSCSKAFIMNSWDKFMIPKPFSKLTFILGEPLEAGSMTIEGCTEILESRMRADLLNLDKLYNINIL